MHTSKAEASDRRPSDPFHPSLRKYTPPRAYASQHDSATSLTLPPPHDPPHHHRRPSDNLPPVYDPRAAPPHHHPYPRPDDGRRAQPQYGQPAPSLYQHASQPGSTGPSSYHRRTLSQSQLPSPIDATDTYGRSLPPGAAPVEPGSRPPPHETSRHRDPHRQDSMDHAYYSHPPGAPTLHQYLSSEQQPGAPLPLHPPPGPPPHTMDPSMPPQYHPLPPHQTHYEPMPQYGAYYGGHEQNQQRRKAVRAAQACDICRQKKAKCDEARPACGNCMQNNFECNYRSLPPPKQDRTLQSLQEEVRDAAVNNQEGLHHLNGNLNRAVNQIIEAIHRVNPTSGTPAGPIHSHPMHRDSTAGSQQGSSAFRMPQLPQVNQDALATPFRDQYKQSPGSQYGMKQRQISDNASDAGHSSTPSSTREVGSDHEFHGQLSLGANHTTGAHNLRSWPQIERFFDKVDPHYVRIGESKHHIDLSHYTRAPPNHEFGNMKQSASTPSAANSPFDDASSVSSASMPKPMTAHTDVNTKDGSIGARSSPGGRNQNQSLSIDAETARSLCDSYFEHVHVLQPFLDRRRTQDMVDQFVASYCSEPISDAFEPRFVRSESANGVKKRKHEEGKASWVDPASGEQKPAPFKKPILRTVDNALILLIFALGRISKHRGPLPAPVAYDGPVEAVMSPPISTPTTRAAYGTTISSGPSDRPPRDRMDADECMKEPLNIDRLPGAAYFSHAVSILGEVHGENSLMHVQAALLAGLYLGQLLFVYDSWKWINTACTAWLMLLKDLDENDETAHEVFSEKQVELEPELLAFWACLILESDIIAELRVVPSGISRFESKMLLPRDDLRGEEGVIRRHFMGQMTLRKIGNRTHAALYTAAKEKEVARLPVVAKRIDASVLNEQLQGFRSCVPDFSLWADGDAGSTNINEARLRGKYYGIKNIINRPALSAVLESTNPNRQMLAGTDRNQQVKGHGADFKAALACIDAIRHSTLAFDKIPGMPGRLVVTNIFGTAQAQFGNMLVLAAAALSNITAQHFTLHMYGPLLKRTIAFLEPLAPLSPTMTTNLHVLETIRSEIHARLNEGSQPPSAHASFTN